MPMPAPYVTIGSGRIMRPRTNEDLQAAGWISWSPGGGWRFTRAGRAYMRHLLALYTREDAARDLARLRERHPRRRQAREPVFGERARGGR